ncbi:unnamed protein product [Clonostachys byssicola]|uniref:Uncharacterized protein n=1 Tax=Clonostachys byssicola TaxID=160290 RepID=A0A9N9XYN7_9HYPO|nr:unnamed protein product [Clonostachys byssicola]
MPSNLEKISQHLGPKNTSRKSNREVAFDLFPLCVGITSELKSRSPRYENRDHRNDSLVRHLDSAALSEIRI